MSKLEIELQNEINGYLFYALPYCVLKTSPELVPWLMEHYIECFSNDYPSFFYSDAVNFHRVFKLNEVMDINYFSYDYLHPDWDIKTIIENSIKTGRYVIIYLDEYYIPGRSSYQRHHFVHESLIFGYDEQEYDCIAFDLRHCFAKQKMDKRHVNLAYWEAKKYAHEQEYNHSIVTLKLKTLPTFKFSIERFQQRIDNYAKGKTGFSEYLYSGVFTEEAFAGIDATKAYVNFLKSDKSNYFELFTAIHSWYEHKAGLYRRFVYINETAHDAIITAESITKYNNIVMRANEIRMLSLKITNKPHYGMLLSRMISKLDEINAMEQEVLTDFL